MDIIILGGKEYPLQALNVRKQMLIGKKLLEVIATSTDGLDINKTLIPTFDLCLEILKIYFNLTDKDIDLITEIDEVQIAINKIQAKYPFSKLLSLSMGLLTNSTAGIQQGEVTSPKKTG